MIFDSVWEVTYWLFGRGSAANMPSFNCCPKRYLTITLTSLGMLVSHAMRVNMAITVVTILDAMPHSKVGTDQARDSVSVI